MTRHLNYSTNLREQNAAGRFKFREGLPIADGAAKILNGTAPAELPVDCMMRPCTSLSTSRHYSSFENGGDHSKVRHHKDAVPGS
jgi:hypothetical protein